MKVKASGVCSGWEKIIPVDTGQWSRHQVCFGLWMSGWQKVSPSGAHKKEKVLAECQAGLWEAFRSSFCLSGTTSRTREERSGTGTEMIQACLSNVWPFPSHVTSGQIACSNQLAWTPVVELKFVPTSVNSRVDWSFLYKAEAEAHNWAGLIIFKSPTTVLSSKG